MTKNSGSLFLLLLLGACAAPPDRALDGPMPPDIVISRSPPNTPPLDITFHSISGVWMNLVRTRNVGDFELKNVRVSGEKFTASFYWAASWQLSCSFSRDVQGTYRNQVLEFETELPCENISFRPAISTVNWRGYYLAGVTGKGWMIVKRVVEPSSK